MKGHGAPVPWIDSWLRESILRNANNFLGHRDQAVGARYSDLITVDHRIPGDAVRRVFSQGFPGLIITLNQNYGWYEIRRVSGGSQKQSDVQEFGAADGSVPEWIYKPWIKKALKQQNDQYLYEVEPVTLNKQQVRRFVIEDTKGTMPVNINAWHYLTRDRKFLIEVVRPGLAPEIREHAVNVHEPGEAEQQLIIEDKEKEDKGKVQEFLGMFEQDESRMAHILQSAKERAGQPELIAYDRWQISEIVQNPARLARMLAEDRTLHYDLVEYFMGKSVREQIETYDKMFYAALKRAARKAGTLGIAEKAAYKLRISNRVQVMPSDLSPFAQKVYITVLEHAYRMKQSQKTIPLDYLNILLAGSLDPGDLAAIQSKIVGAIGEINADPLSLLTIPLPSYAKRDLFTSEPRPILTRINVNRLKVWEQSKIEGLEGADKLAKKTIVDLFGNQSSFRGQHGAGDDFDGIWTLEIAIRRLAAGEDEVVYEEGNQRIVLRNFRRNLAGGFSFNALSQHKTSENGGSSSSWAYSRTTRVDFIDEAYPLVSVMPSRVIPVPDHIYLSHSRVVSLTMININQFRGGGHGDAVVHQRIYYAIQHLLDNSGPNGDRKPVDAHFNEYRGAFQGQQMLARVYPFTREPATDRLVLRIDWWHMTPAVALAYHEGKLPEPDKSTTAYTDDLGSARRQFQGGMKEIGTPQGGQILDRVALSERAAKVIAAKHIGQKHGLTKAFTGMKNESMQMLPWLKLELGEPTLWKAILKLAEGHRGNPLLYFEKGYMVELQPLQSDASGQSKVVLHWFPWTGNGWGGGEITEVELTEPAKGNSVPDKFHGFQKQTDVAEDGDEEFVPPQISDKWAERALAKNSGGEYANPWQTVGIAGKLYKRFVIEDSDEDRMPDNINAWHELNREEGVLVEVVRRGLDGAIRDYVVNEHEPGEAEERIFLEAQVAAEERAKKKERPIHDFLEMPGVTTERIAHALQSAQERAGKTELIPYDVWQIKEIAKDEARLKRMLAEDRTMQHEWIRYFFGRRKLEQVIAYEEMYRAALRAEADRVGGIALTSQTADIRSEGDFNVKMPEQLTKEFEMSDGAGFRIVFIGANQQ